MHVPDLYDGNVFDSLEAGIAYAKEVGFGTILERGRAAADGLPRGCVRRLLPRRDAGADAGPDPAGREGRPALHTCLPASEFGDAWPEGVPVQIHGMEADPFFAEEGDLDAARELVATTDDAELFLYPGDQHLFADSSLPSYDKDAETLLIERVLIFLDDID